jgi:four helix bundle protein
MRNFKELKIWQKGLEIAVESYKLTQQFPPSERFGLSSQIARAAVSISSNIAEGNSRTSEKDYRRFIEIALGSTYELETHIILAKMIGYAEEDALTRILNNIIEEQKMISSFMNSLNA